MKKLILTSIALLSINSYADYHRVFYGVECSLIEKSEVTRRCFLGPARIQAPKPQKQLYRVDIVSCAFETATTDLSPDGVMRKREIFIDIDVDKSNDDEASLTIKAFSYHNLVVNTTWEMRNEPAVKVDVGANRTISCKRAANRDFYTKKLTGTYSK